MQTDRLPEALYPDRFIVAGQSCHATLALSHLPRLQAAVMSAASENGIEVCLDWWLDRDAQRPMISGQLQGRLWLECQRCLQPYEYVLDVVFRLPIVVNAQPGADDEWLLVPPGECLYPLDLIEDEILLGLPLHPKHTGLADCDALMIKRAAQFAPADERETARNPFAVLEKLKLPE